MKKRFAELLISPKEELANLRWIKSVPKPVNPDYRCGTIPQFQIGGRTKKCLDAFVQMINGFSKKVDTQNAYDLAALIAKQSGIKDHYKQDTTEEGKKKTENIEELLNGVQPS